MKENDKLTSFRYSTVEVNKPRHSQIRVARIVDKLNIDYQ